MRLVYDIKMPPYDWQGRPPSSAQRPQQGCICPPTAEKTCQGLMCPRRGYSFGATS